MKRLLVLALAATAASAQEGGIPSAVVSEATRPAASVELADQIELVGKPAEACAIRGLGADGVEFVAVDGGVRRAEWIQVVSLRTARPLALLLANGDRATARLVGVEGSKLKLSSPSFGEIAVGLNSLTDLPVAEAPQDPNAPKTPLTPHDWKGSISLNGSFRAGNTDQVLVALRAAAEKQWEEDKLGFALEALYGKSEGDETNKSLFAKARFDHFYSQRLYSFAQTDALYDAIQDIDLRSITSLGAGYLLWKENDDRLFALEGGLSAIYTKYGTGEDQFSPAARAAATFKEIFFKDLHFTQDVEFLLPLDEVDEFLVRSRTAIAVPVAEGWAMKTSLDVNYTAAPAAGRKPFDILFLVGLEYQF
jgi:putative salt-induced outer membrane protein YdiY